MREIRDSDASTRTEWRHLEDECGRGMRDRDASRMQKNRTRWLRPKSASTEGGMEGVLSTYPLWLRFIVILFALLSSYSLLGQKLELRQHAKQDWRETLLKAHHAELGFGVGAKKHPRDKFVLVACLNANDGFSYTRAVSALQAAGIACMGDEDIGIRFMVVPQSRAKEAKMILAVSSLIYGYDLDYGRAR